LPLTLSRPTQNQFILAAKQELVMAKEDLIDLLAWCKRERDRLQMQREMLRSGTFKLFKEEESGLVDVSSENVAQITASIGELDLILADYGARSSRDAQRS
jgi:hypothetical protein